MGCQRQHAGSAEQQRQRPTCCNDAHEIQQAQQLADGLLQVPLLGSMQAVRNSSAQGPHTAMLGDGLLQDFKGGPAGRQGSPPAALGAHLL